MAEADDLFERPSYVCQSCGAAIEVQVGFKGKVVWTVEPEDPDFSTTQPDLRGDYRTPRLVCSADVMHSTGFRLLDGQILPDAKSGD